MPVSIICVRVGARQGGRELGPRHGGRGALRRVFIASPGNRQGTGCPRNSRRRKGLDLFSAFGEKRPR